MSVSNSNYPVPTSGYGAASPQETYAFPERALRRWSRQHLELENLESDRFMARFHFRGTTCSNMGRALSFTYEVLVQNENGNFRILKTRTGPTQGEIGWESMCASIEDPGFLDTLAETMLLEGELLDRALDWKPEIAPSGCLCSAANRNHKWRLVLQTVHYALQRRAGRSRRD